MSQPASPDARSGRLPWSSGERRVSDHAPIGQKGRGYGPRATRWAGALLVAEQGRAALWLPVLLGLGIWSYLALPAEPPLWTAFLVLLPAAALVTGLARRGGVGGLWLAAGLTAAGLGYTTALVQIRTAAAPVIERGTVETVEGRVIGIGKAASGAPRVLLDRVTVYGVEPTATPARIRIALIETERDATPGPGERVRVYARLFPPGGPVEPGAFDFRQRAFFERIGGVGYALGPVLRVPDAGPTGALGTARLALARLRAQLSDGLRDALPGPEGAFAAAIVTGDRSAIEEDEAEALRAANLAHLLAISGLHMGILCGLVFAAVRLGVAAVPVLALRISGKKIAAVAALLAGAAYLALSGATVPTQRAFVMAAVVLVAVLLDRPALTLRALAVAATIVMLLRPTSILNPGFQMSFAATLALIAVFERLRPPSASGRRGIARRIALYAGGVLLTSFVAGLATAPFAAAHFNRLPLWGLPANLVAVPVMGLWIAPAAVGAALLAPVGLEGPALEAMGLGIGWVLDIAREVEGWPGAVRPVAAMPDAALALIAAGGLWLAIWRTGLRLGGVLGIAAGLGLAVGGTDRPQLLIAPEARLVGVMGPEGRALDHPRAQSFAAKIWLQRDGDLADQETAAERPGFRHGRGGAGADLGDGWGLEILPDREPDPVRLDALCRPGTLLVARHGGPVEGACCYLGARELSAGALAIDPGPAGLTITVAGGDRERPWSGAARPSMPDCPAQ